jgi:hypothetical protein
MDDKKRLLVINGSQFGYSAGHYYYCKYLKDEFIIEYVTYDRGFNKLSLPNVKVNYVPFVRGKLKRTFDFLFSSIRISRTTKPDVLFVVYFDFCFILSLFCFGKLKVLDIRTGSLNPNRIMRQVENKILHLQSFFFNKNITLSESLRQVLRIPISKTLVLPLGAEVYYKGEHDFTKLKLLYVGTLDGRRITDTIDGLNIFLKEHNQFKNLISYHIVGFASFDLINTIKKKISDYNLQEIVSFEGIKTQVEIAKYFAQCNIGVAYVPVTEYYNVQPMTKIVEYVLSGLFTIATNSYENNRIINQNNGLLCFDNAQSFSESLEQCSKYRYTYNSNLIRATLKGYEWEVLVRDHLCKFLR